MGALAAALLFGALLFYLMIVVPIVGFSFEPSDLSNATKGGRWLNRVSQSRLWLGVLGALTVWLCSVGIALVLRVLTMIFGGR
ncbi:MAG: hypothetical protein ACREXP_07460 [Steroidobacteraceae bacterium]